MTSAQPNENTKESQTAETSTEGSKGNGAAELSPEQAAAARLKEAENRYLYLYAEFENFKKRVIKERADLLKFGWENQARELLPIVDNLERAIQHAPKDLDTQFLQGVQMVLNEFRNALKKQGVELIETQNKPFDLNLHEAVGQEASSLPNGSVIREVQTGYTLHGRLLRPARVVISTGQG